MHHSEPVGFEYDQEECDQFAFHLERVLATCRTITKRRGADYGGEYARSIAEQVIAAGQDDRWADALSITDQVTDGQADGHH